MKQPGKQLEPTQQMVEPPEKRESPPKVSNQPNSPLHNIFDVLSNLDEGDAKVNVGGDSIKNDVVVGSLGGTQTINDKEYTKHNIKEKGKNLDIDIEVDGDMDTEEYQVMK